MGGVWAPIRGVSPKGKGERKRKKKKGKGRFRAEVLRTLDTVSRVLTECKYTMLYIISIFG
jgi:hypothetical protein